jgi:serine/threonine protein kinase
LVILPGEVLKPNLELRPTAGSSTVLQPIVFELADGRSIIATLADHEITTLPMGNNLRFTLLLKATTTVPESYLHELGFDAQRLVRLDIVPQNLLLNESRVEREVPAGEEDRMRLATLRGYAEWIKSKDFSMIIRDRVNQHLRQGPESRFRSTL